jgi:hypothetical protein
MVRMVSAVDRVFFEMAGHFNIARRAQFSGGDRRRKDEVSMNI